MTLAIRNELDAFDRILDELRLGKSMRVTLPYPPSVNRYWKTARGITFLTPEARDYKYKASMIAASSGMKPVAGDVYVLVDVYRPQKSGDLDNTLKGMLDALRGIAYEDDKQITGIFARRYDDKHDPRAEIAIHPTNAVGSQGLLIQGGSQ